MIPRLFSLHLNSIMFTPYSISFLIVVDCHRYSHGCVKTQKRVYFERDAIAAGWFKPNPQHVGEAFGLQTATAAGRREPSGARNALARGRRRRDVENLERQIGQVRHVLALEVPPVQRGLVILVGEAPVPGYLALGKAFRGRGGDVRGVRGPGPSETREAFRRRRGSTATVGAGTVAAFGGRRAGQPNQDQEPGDERGWGRHQPARPPRASWR